MLSNLSFRGQRSLLFSAGPRPRSLRTICIEGDASGTMPRQVGPRLGGPHGRAIPLLRRKEARHVVAPPFGRRSITLTHACHGPACPLLLLQLFELPNLQNLILRRAQYSSSSMAPLTQLTSLTCIWMSGCQLPSSLPAVTWLCSLELPFWRTPAAEATQLLRAALPRMQLLLDLTLFSRSDTPVPVDVASSLTCLRFCSVVGGPAAPINGRTTQQLPAGVLGLQFFGVLLETQGSARALDSPGLYGRSL